jgi:hypothetical protein
MKACKTIGCFLLGMLSLANAYAVCPLCTIAVGVGVGLSRWLGIDDTISGVWIGGLTVSFILWTIAWFNQKNWHFRGRDLLIVFVYYAMVAIPFYHLEVVGHPLNRLWGMDKLLLGLVLGSITFLGGHLAYVFLKQRHGGHAYFPFQKVVMPVSPLIFFSIFFWLITR